MKENITVGTIPQTPKQEPFWKLFGIGFVYFMPFPFIYLLFTCSLKEIILGVVLLTLVIVLPVTSLFYICQKPLKEEEKPIGMRYPWEHPF